MVSILLLKEGITKGADQSREEASLANSPKHAALVAVLSVFRRPLSIPVVRSLTERWLWPKKGDVTAPNPDTDPAEPIQVAHDYVNHILDALQKGRYVVIHQGGRIRLEKSIHELFYGGLTSELHVGGVILEWEERYASDASQRAYAIVQGALVASLHFAAARTMYVDVFLLTRDVQAFYEYLYHRVAVLRILMVMIAMLRLPLPGTMGTAPATIYGKVRTVLKQIYARFKSSSHDDSKIGKKQDVLHQTVLKKVSASADSESRARARRILRDFTELEVKARLGKEYPPWHGLDGSCSFEDSKELREIEKLAVQYETMLRETSRDPLEDARHRSSAYVLRARVLYLQGRFQTAHRYLDLAASGSSEINIEHAVGHAAIRLARAELLLYSSGLHLLKQYDQSEKAEKDLVSREKDELAKEANKIRRAESEVQRAATLLDPAQHQTIWSLRVHMGIAKATFARLLLEIEKLVRSEHALDENAFARLSGQLEQSVLNGMQHLRSALDLLPFITQSSDKIRRSVIALVRPLKMKGRYASCGCSYMSRHGSIGEYCRNCMLMYPPILSRATARILIEEL